MPRPVFVPGLYYYGTLTEEPTVLRSILMRMAAAVAQVLAVRAKFGALAEEENVVAHWVKGVWEVEEDNNNNNWDLQDSLAFHDKV